MSLHVKSILEFMLWTKHVFHLNSKENPTSHQWEEKMELNDKQSLRHILPIPAHIYAS